MAIWNRPPAPCEEAIFNIYTTSLGGADGYCPRKKVEAELAWDTQHRRVHMVVTETVRHPLRALENRAQKETTRKKN